MKEQMLWHIKFGYGKYIREEVGSYIIEFNNNGVKKISEDFLGKTLFFSPKDVINKKIYEENQKCFEEAKRIYQKKIICELEENLKKENISKLLTSITKMQKEKEKKEEYYYNEFFEYLEKKFKFEGFHHYTDFTNFINIMKEQKLYSRKKIMENGKLQCDAADKEVIIKTENNVLNYVRFYFSSKTPTLYKSEGIKLYEKEDESHMPSPVLFIFDKKISKVGKKYFTNKNAGSKYKQVFNNFENILKSREWDWKFIFDRNPIPDCDEIKKHIISCRNAEYLHFNEVDILYANKIIFRTSADFKNAISLFGKKENFFVDNSKFNYKNLININCLEDYIIEQRDSEIKVKMFFIREIEKTITNTIEISYENGEIEKIIIEPSKIKDTTYEVIFKLKYSIKFNLIYNFNGYKIIYYKGMEDITV